MSTKRFWCLGAAVVWVGTRDRELADSIATDAWSLHSEVLASPEAATAARKALTGELLAGRLASRYLTSDGRRVFIPAEAWVTGPRRGPQGIVIGATVERPANGSWRNERVIGGMVPFFVPAEVEGAFPAHDEQLAVRRDSNAARRGGRPKSNNEPYIEVAADMLSNGDSERAIRSYLKVKLSDDLPALGESAILKRISGTIMPEARERIGKNST